MRPKRQARTKAGFNVVVTGLPGRPRQMLKDFVVGTATAASLAAAIFALTPVKKAVSQLPEKFRRQPIVMVSPKNATVIRLVKGQMVIEVPESVKARQRQLLQKELRLRLAAKPVPVTMVKAVSTAGRKYDDIIKSLSEYHEVDPVLIHRIIERESSYKKKEVSSSDARGLMQLKKIAVRQAQKLGSKITWDKVFDERLNIDAGILNLKFCRDMLKDRKFYYNGKLTPFTDFPAEIMVALRLSAFRWGPTDKSNDPYAVDKIGIYEKDITVRYFHDKNYAPETKIMIAHQNLLRKKGRLA